MPQKIQKAAYQALTSFEAEADKLMGALSIWGLPFRSIYSSVILGAEVAFSGGRFKADRKPDGEKGATMLARLTYWRPYLSTATAELGRDLQNALDAVTPEMHAEIRQALIYAHFCELMPFAHRGAFRIEQTADGFRLSYPNKDAAHYEALDVIASELALTAMEKHFPFNPAPYLRMIETWPRLDGDFIGALRDAYKFHLKNVYEDIFIGAEAYERVLGFTHEEFKRVRAALMAYGTWCLGMANAAEAGAMQEKGERHTYFAKECLEWLAPLHVSRMVLGVTDQIAGVPRDRVDKILRYFQEPAVAGATISGEGYLAPIQVLGDSFLLSPRALQLMTPERNILYVLNQVDRKQFDELVSGELEPSLLVHARPIFEALPGVEIKTNVIWAGREIDIVGYCPKTNSAVQVQAKAAIPANGARMTRQLETNTLKAIEQLQAFEKLAPAEKDEMIRTTFKVDAENVRWSSAVLSRSSFGTVRAWEAMQGRGALNLQLLQSIVNDVSAEDAFDLATLPHRAMKTMSDITGKCFKSWREETLDVFGTKITIPLLDLDYPEIGRARAALLRR
ncbi:hypothetical protein [Rhizobium lentis]|uniref:Uncharacterized protein n=1 Tax=Rhizobium lentis TaxID=1138194 RepID=A0A7W8XJ70_9HYPH|nr:hypothetical protein [Rhizobium lentis]MBB5553667.1 hypothetical protein [Rhizobium lentis]MBB5563786.1 hypothetical protein [Rhizobium lentis]MBB5570699.1 hypothetical protein [Rhizobium lentis]